MLLKNILKVEFILDRIKKLIFSSQVWIISILLQLYISDF